MGASAVAKQGETDPMGPEWVGLREIRKHLVGTWRRGKLLDTWVGGMGTTCQVLEPSLGHIEIAWTSSEQLGSLVHSQAARPTEWWLSGICMAYGDMCLCSDPGLMSLGKFDIHKTIAMFKILTFSRKLPWAPPHPNSYRWLSSLRNGIPQ